MVGRKQLCGRLAVPLELTKSVSKFLLTTGDAAAGRLRGLTDLIRKITPWISACDRIRCGR